MSWNIVMMCREHKRAEYWLRLCGGVVRAPGPRFKSRSDHQPDVVLGSPEFNFSATLVNC